MAFDKKTLLATTMVAGMVLTFPSFAAAQSQADEDEDRPVQAQATEVEAIVVTGSRIRRSEFTSTQPVQIITSEEATLEGLVDTTEILQGSTAANTAGQINNFFTGFITTGGPGVNTISLRGLGAQRTLVLMNGRRVGPAGARGQVGPADLNTIPSSLIDRVEILTDGASSIYGSDAVAGVINIITRQNLDGGSAEVYYNAPQEGGGEVFQASVSHGWTFDRGYISAGAEYFEREAVLFGDRDYFACPQDYVFYDDNYSMRADLRDANGDYKCYQVFNGLIRATYAGGSATFARSGDYVFDSSAVDNYPGFNVATPWMNSVATVVCPANGIRPGVNLALIPAGPCTPGAVVGWTTAQGEPYNLNGFRTVSQGHLANAAHPDAPNTDRRRAIALQSPQTHPNYLSRTAVSPVTRMSFNVFGGFDLTPTTELFGELLFNRRESEQNSWRQLFPTVSPFHSLNPFGGPFNGSTLTPNAGHWALPVATVPMNMDQQVDYVRVVGGIRGSLNVGRGWDWELAAQYSRSDADYGGNFFYNDRVEAAAGYYAAVGQDLEGFPAPGGARAFGAATGNCDTFLLISTTSCPTGGINWFTQDFVENGVLPAEELNWLMGYEVGNTIYEHKYVEGVISGELFDLPAGPLGMALGFQLRQESINDQPGPEAARANSWGLTTSGPTVGEDTIREVFAEFEVPLIRNQPFFNELTLNLSGRFSDYDSYGDSTTHKVGLNWQIAPAFRVRASHGTSFRAPALFELYLGGQVGFQGQTAIDPCASTSRRNTDPVLDANCLADGVPVGYTAGGSSSARVIGIGGAGRLEPETAESNTVGFIWTPSFINLNIALDYYKIEVEDQVAQFGAGSILNECYTSSEFPADPFCDLFTREMDPSSPRFNQIISVDNSYVNIARQLNDGLDLTVRYTHELAAGDLTLNGRVTHILNWETQLFNASEPTIQVGRIGQPEWVGQLSARFDRGDWTFFWNADIVGPTSNADFLAEGNTGTYYGVPAYFMRETGWYDTHNLSVRRRFDQWTLQAGVQNAFNRQPPFTSVSGGGTRIGTTPLTSQYDWWGRRLFVNISRSW